MSNVNLRTVGKYTDKLVQLLEVAQHATGAGGPLAGAALEALHAALTTALSGDATAGDLDVAIERLRKALATNDAAADAELAAKFPSTTTTKG